jgi:hypothetical protein
MWNFWKKQRFLKILFALFYRRNSEALANICEVSSSLRMVTKNGFDSLSPVILTVLSTSA